MMDWCISKIEEYRCQLMYWGKSIVRAFVARVCYWVGLTEIFYWLNKKAKRIITFHNVLPDDIIGKLPKVGCMDSQSDFLTIIDEVAKRFGFSTNLSDAKTATITFDDGMLNQYEVAGVLLHDRGIPAILFVAGDAIDSSAENSLITDRLLIWNAFAPDSAVKTVFGEVLPRGELWVKRVQPKYREDWKNRGKEFLRTLEETYPIEKILDQLPSEWVRLRLCGVRREQLEELRRWGWKIGWHTKTHFPLGMLDRGAKLEELMSPEALRKEPLGYPYGDIESIGTESLNMAAQLGYPYAVSNDPDFSEHRGRYFMLRLALPPNRYELHFVLSGLKYFLKFWKLMPVAMHNEACED